MLTCIRGILDTLNAYILYTRCKICPRTELSEPSTNALEVEQFARENFLESK